MVNGVTDKGFVRQMLRGRILCPPVGRQEVPYYGPVNIFFQKHF